MLAYCEGFLLQNMVRLTILIIADTSCFPLMFLFLLILILLILIPGHPPPLAQVALLTYDDSVKRLIFGKKLQNHDVITGLLR